MFWLFYRTTFTQKIRFKYQFVFNKMANVLWEMNNQPVVLKTNFQKESQVFLPNGAPKHIAISYQLDDQILQYPLKDSSGSGLYIRFRNYNPDLHGILRVQAVVTSDIDNMFMKKYLPPEDALPDAGLVTRQPRVMYLAKSTPKDDLPSYRYLTEAGAAKYEEFLELLQSIKGDDEPVKGDVTAVLVTPITVTRGTPKWIKKTRGFLWDRVKVLDWANF